MNNYIFDENNFDLDIRSVEAADKVIASLLNNLHAAPEILGIPKHDLSKVIPLYVKLHVAQESLRLAALVMHELREEANALGEDECCGGSDCCSSDDTIIP